MGSGVRDVPVVEIASGLLACGRAGGAFDGGSSVCEKEERAVAEFVEGGLEEEGALGSSVEGGATIGIVAVEVLDDFFKSVVEMLLDSGGVGGELQLNDDMV